MGKKDKKDTRHSFDLETMPNFNMNDAPDYRLFLDGEEESDITEDELLKAFENPNEESYEQERGEDVIEEALKLGEKFKKDFLSNEDNAISNEIVEDIVKQLETIGQENDYVEPGLYEIEGKLHEITENGDMYEITFHDIEE